MSAQLEQWRVSTVEGVFETDLETLRQWITEGSVAPTDKVSKGNLNWIDAGRAPMLKAAFQGESVTTAAPPSVSTTPADQTWQEGTEPHDGSFGHNDAEILKIRRRFPPVVTTIRTSRHITSAPPAPRGCVKRAGSFWKHIELPRALCAENSARFMRRSKHARVASRFSVQVSALMILCGPCAIRFNTKLRFCAAP